MKRLIVCLALLTLSACVDATSNRLNMSPGCSVHYAGSKFSGGRSSQIYYTFCEKNDTVTTSFTTARRIGKRTVENTDVVVGVQ